MIAKAFRQLGHDVIEYGNIYQTPERLLYNPRDWNEIDLWVYCEMNDADPQYHELNTFSVRKTACWLFDTSYYPDRCKSIVDYFRFDHVFIANPLTIQEYKIWGYKNVHYLPYACDAELHSRPLSYPKTADVALVGSIRDDRIKLQKELAQHGVELELMSDVFRESYIDALASARIVVNQNPPEGRGLLNMRFWEAQAAGAVICTEHDDIHANWDIGLKTTGVLCYQDAQQLAANCKMFLAKDSNPSIDAIAACSQASVLQNHTYQKRCKHLLETVFPHG
jgi:spore maturation protein CgeB